MLFFWAYATSRQNRFVWSCTRRLVFSVLFCSSSSCLLLDRALLLTSPQLNATQRTAQQRDPTTKIDSWAHTPLPPLTVDRNRDRKNPNQRSAGWRSAAQRSACTAAGDDEFISPSLSLCFRYLGHFLTNRNGVSSIHSSFKPASASTGHRMERQPSDKTKLGGESLQANVTDFTGTTKNERTHLWILLWLLFY